MSRLALPGALHTVVSKAFVAAKRSDSLVFSSTELTTIHTRQGVPFQLRYCPALANKPKPQSAESANSTTTEKPDPFENPPADLLVAELPNKEPSHILVLNKYPVIPNHFILATKTSKPQTDVLEEDDLDVAHACLRSWEDGNSNIDGNGNSNHFPRKLFAFFNSGEHSGASQAHRHLQFLPYEDMVGPSQQHQVEWQLLVDGMTEPCGEKQHFLHAPLLPFRHYAMRIPSEPSSMLLHQTYLKLYRAAVEAVQSFHAEGTSSMESSESKDPITATISYNLAMTLDMMAICPRRREAASVPASSGEGSVPCNGTILAGTLMVKDEGEWESLQRDPDLISHVLSTIGIPVEGDHSDQWARKL